jgi:trigger factor
MDTSLTQVDSVNTILKIEVKKADYEAKVNDAIKDFRKKASIPGFRPGNVPVGMVKKMYGKSIMAEQINKLVGENLYKYIQDNKLNVLGEPLPNEEKQQPINFDTQEDFDFYFDIALAPEIKLELSKKDKIDYYQIAVDEEMVDKQIASYKANYGKYESVEDGSKATDLLKGVVVELSDGQPKEGGIRVEDAVLMASYMKDEEEQVKFVNVNTGAEIVFNPGKAYDGNETEIASFLHIKKEEAATIAPEFKFTVTEITRYQEAELNQELFDKIFGENAVTTEADFRQKVKDSISAQMAPDSDYKFLLDVRKLLETKAGDLQFPDAFLKRWLLVSGEGRTPESVEEDYPKIIEDLKFHLIKEQLVKDNDIKVEDSDIRNVAVQTARAQFAQYGMAGVPDEMIQNYAEQLLKKKEHTRNFIDRAIEDKLVTFLKSTLGLNVKEITMDEFRKFFEPETKEAQE